ncbi:MAG: hypothetical protein AMXMBFR33_65680 [Candidatus Xenobia bacterium]|jgi:hypothetical protein
MKKPILALVLAAGLLGTSLAAQEGVNSPSERLRKLIEGLPAIGQQVESTKLGIRMTVGDHSPRPGDVYEFAAPSDLDRHQTDLPPLKGRFPDLHLNIPLKVVPGSVNYLFLSDQPEEIRDDRKRVPAKPGGGDPGPGAVGVYARSPLPGAAPIRVLMDHTNGTKRPLVMWLVWVPEKDSFVSVRKRGESKDKNSVKAGGEAFVGFSKTIFEPRAYVHAGASQPLVRMPLTPGVTGVVHLEYTATDKGELFAAVTEEDQVPTLAELQEMPVLHSIVWEEEIERLDKFIDPEKNPTRFHRIKKAFQHARGHFQFPERVGHASYSVPSWSEKSWPVQVYSVFESTPGVDVTVDGGATTDNRGKYGARTGFDLELKELPPGCREVALVVINRSSPYGGRHWVSNGRQASEVIYAPGVGSGLLGNKAVSTLWRGPVKRGDRLTMWQEPMANGSVQLWYMVVPIP